VIRERLDQDLDRLCAVLAALEPLPASLRGVDPRRWLTEHDAEVSWVFDQAPVRVAPTGNVVGHVQVYRPGPGLGVQAAEELLVIGKLVVAPTAHADGIGRFLLRESVRHVRARGARPVVDLRETGFPASFFARAGLSALPAAEPDGVLLIDPR
jgi:GNAT superfamily N-acetyltransferase